MTIADKENIDNLIYAEDSYKSITHDSNFYKEGEPNIHYKRKLPKKKLNLQ